jgi:ferredoxin
VASGRLAAVCIDQYLRLGKATGEDRKFNSRLAPMTEAEFAAAIAGCEKRPRVVAGPPSSIASPPAAALSSSASAAKHGDAASTASGVRPAGPAGGVELAVFEKPLSKADAVAEAGRCLHCDCRKKDACRLRDAATEYGANQRRFRGERRTVAPDASHPQIVYDAGKCIMCGICIRIAEKFGEKPGLTFLGRGFSARMGGAFMENMAGALGAAAVACAEACPTGALAVKTDADLR